MVELSEGHEYMGSTRGSGIASSTADLQGMRVVRVMRGVGGACEMCVCLDRGGVGGEGGEWMIGFGFGLHQSFGNRKSVGRVSVFVLQWCG